MHLIEIAAMNPCEAAATKVFEAMKMEVVFVGWLAEMEAIHYNNYRALFEAGAVERPMEFLFSARSSRGHGEPCRHDIHTNRADQGLAANSP
jgi:hypothetical protein